MIPDPRPPTTLTAAQAKSRRLRNIAIGLMVGGLAVLFYVITLAKIGSRVFNMSQG